VKMDGGYSVSAYSNVPLNHGVLRPEVKYQMLRRGDVVRYLNGEDGIEDGIEDGTVVVRS